MVYVLYNSTAGAHFAPEIIKERLAEFFPGAPITVTDTLTIDNKQEYVSSLSSDDALVLVGGDGTLNRFVNAVDTDTISFSVYCYAGGTGNDFINDVVGEEHNEPILINEYIKKLPTVSVNGKSYKFINGIGYGIDGWCCEEGDKYREKTHRAPNYTAIAIRGLLYKFKPVKARVTVDGVTLESEYVWMAPTMNGRYFGGGMMITPAQDRLNAGHELSVVTVPCKHRLKLLTVFPKIFKGNHVRHTEIFKLRCGRNISVEFDRPVALQIDGETVLGVTEYSAKSYSEKKEKNKV